MAKSAKEIIATHLGWDMADMEEYRYQSTQLQDAAYTSGDDYYTCPPKGRKPSGKDRWGEKVFNWQPDGELFGRTIYVHKSR